MSPRLNKEKFQQLTEFERGRIIGFREGFSYHAIGASVKPNSSTVMRVWKQLIDERRITRKTGSGRRKVMSARDDRHLLRMVVNDRTASSRQLAARWSTATGILMPASTICRHLLHRGLPARVPLYRIPLTFKVIPFFHSIPGAIFQQDNARPHVAKIVRDFCSTQHMQLLPWSAYSPDMSPIEHVWDLVGHRFVCNPCPAASKDEFLLCIQATWSSFPQADIQNLFDSMSHVV
ncbi:transposable element Tcb2 transposase [Trichonephila clavipes]|nr:transposable element Tcb2 transposase [Trichonephila clavipes]